MSESFEDILNEADEVEAVTTETPEAATEAPAVEAETEAVEEVVQPEAPQGYTQDARGVWHRADGTIASKDEVAKFAQKEGAPAAPADATASIASDGAVAAAPPPTPFSFKSQGQDIPLEGATLDKDGNLVVSKSSLPSLLPMLARAQEYPTYQSRQDRLTNEVTQYQKSTRELSTRAEKAEFAYQHLAAILDNEEKLMAFLSDPREREYALRELQLGMRNAEIARATADQASQSQAQTAEQTAAQELETIVGAVQQVAKSPEMQALAAFITPEDITDATAYFKEMRGAIVKTAEDDSLVQYGISKGEKYVTHQPMIQYLSRIATERKKAAERLEAATKAQRFNQSQTIQKPQVKRPAAVAAATTPKRPKNWDETYNDAWKAGDDDE